ncbi:restriction endonuclease subunit S [Zoogloea sp. LCSB751]|uniref:restriction endonuclease subunit S n=1 Tax=Zoogloea sp. LCSB751 TaxID=1965277 RepID=UPI0009A4F464|nr:restriction endonuclease subunit S [Zoogloea sp. LCSB751]
MSLPRYPEYKDSGVAWLGDVPAHWNVLRIKHLVASLEQGWSPQCEGFPVQSEDEWGVLKVGCVNGGMFRPEENKTLPPELEPLPELGLACGDLLISRANTRELVGSTAVTLRDYPRLMLCDKLYRLRLRPDTCAPVFLALYLGTPRVRGQIELSATGASSSMLNIGQSTILELDIAAPSPDEQTAIATFLDRETTKIDTLIAEQEKLLTLLAEKRQATISHAVTKGLNPDAPMKDSGVEWLGEVPTHWDVVRLKNVIATIKAGPFGSALTKDMYVSSGYKVYGQEQVIPGDFSIGDYYISEEKFRELAQYEVEPGDILISCVGTFGKIAIVPKGVEPGIINPRLIRMRVSEGISEEFATEVLRSQVVFEQFSVLSRGGTMDVINIGTLSGIFLPVPSPSEQESILTFIEAETTHLDTLTAEATRAILLLKERRTALISAAVTGKIDVRNLYPEQETCHA